MLWIIIILVLVPVILFSDRAHSLLSPIVRTVVGILNPKMKQFNDEKSILLAPIYRTKSDIASAMSATQVVDILEAAINSVDTEKFIKQWDEFIKENPRLFRGGQHPIHIEIIEFMSWVIARISSFENKKERQGERLLSLVCNNKSLRIALESDGVFLHPNLIGLFATWCPTDNLTAFLHQATFDPTFLVNIYSIFCGSTKSELVSNLVWGDFVHGEVSTADVEYRWKLIQSSVFWHSWPHPELEWKQETSRRMEERINRNQ